MGKTISELVFARVDYLSLQVLKVSSSRTSVARKLVASRRCSARAASFHHHRFRQHRDHDASLPGRASGGVIETDCTTLVHLRIPSLSFSVSYSTSVPPITHLFLPVAGVPRPLGDVRQAVLDAGADVGEAVANGAANAARQAVDGLAEATRGAADDAADGVAHAGDGVAQDAGLQEGKGWFSGVSLGGPRKRMCVLLSG